MTQAFERTRPPLPGEAARRRLEAMIRVDHAGEFGAVQIYRGQRAVFARADSKARAAALVTQMEQSEEIHLKTFDRLLLERGVRPTALAPFWRLAGFGLGAATALLGEKAAHACTVAVEEVIEEHYAAQSEELAEGFEGGDGELKDIVTRFRSDELAHRDTALAEGAEQAPGYALLCAAIKFGCRMAIRASEKV